MSNKVFKRVEDIVIGSQIYSVVIAKKENEVCGVIIRKETNNPWNSMGKEYTSFDECIKSYKNPKMVSQLNGLKDKYDSKKVLKDIIDSKGNRVLIYNSKQPIKIMA